MRLLGIVSHGNGAGKTLFIERLLEAHPGRFAAVKFTTVFRDGNCPKDAQRRCACTRLHEAFTVISDDQAIRTENTDTGRIARAGADPVIWCLCKPGEHAAGWAHVQELLPGDRELVTEGNSAMEVIPSDALIFLVNPAMPQKFWKSNWLALLQRSRAVVVNDAPGALGRRAAAAPEERRRALDAVHEAAPQTPRVVARLDEPWAAWAGDLLEELVAPGQPA